MNKTALPVISITTALLAACAVALPSCAQSLDIGGLGSFGIGGIPGVNASPYPSANIQPSTIGGGNMPAFQAPSMSSPAQAAGAVASGSQFASSGAQGLAGRDSNYTRQQTIALPTNRSYSLPPTSMNLMGPNSVDMAPVPSAHWHYGFPNEGMSAFRGVTGGSIGGFLPATSTASVDINTYDGPVANPGTASYATFGSNNINFAVPIGGVTIGGSINPNNAFQSLQNSFGSPF